MPKLEHPSPRTQFITGPLYSENCQLSQPSIAQLEERETVIGCSSSQGHWFDPGSRDSFVF
jgi:hypothetical protein